MSGAETVKAITDNLQGLLRSQGIQFTREVFEEVTHIPASLLPLGQIFYQGEDFEYTHGERPGYVEAIFLVRVLLRERDPQSKIRAEQTWVHRIRDSLTVDSLNTGSLSESKPVSRITISRATIDHIGHTAVLNCTIRIRYREQ